MDHGLLLVFFIKHLILKIIKKNQIKLNEKKNQKEKPKKY